MRNVFWCGASMMLTAALAVYLAASYAAKHDNGALVARALELGQTVAPAVRPSVLAAIGDNSAPAAEINMPEVIADYVHHTDLGLIEIPISTQAPRIIINEEEEMVQTGIQMDPCTPNGCTYPVETVVAGEIESPDNMPYVEDEEAPETMPYAGDEDEAAEKPMFIQRIIQRLIEAAQKFGSTDEPSEGCMPCYEDEQPMEEPQVMEEEPMAEPDYHHQHPAGCTRGSSVCPYSGRSYEPAPEPEPQVETSIKKKKKSKKKEVDSMEFRETDADPDTYPQ